MVPAITTPRSPTRRLTASAVRPTRGGEARNPDTQQHAHDREPDACRQPRQLVARVHRRRNEGRDPEARDREPDQRRGRARHRQREAHAHGGDDSTRAYDGALPEAVDDAVAGEPPDRHRSLQRDEREPGDGGRRAEVVLQVDRAPRGARVFDDRAARREHAEGRQRADRRPRDLPAMAIGPFGVVRPPQHESVRDDRDRAKSTEAVTRAVSSDTSSAIVAAPMRPPATAPTLQIPWNELTIDRP